MRRLSNLGAAAELPLRVSQLPNGTQISVVRGFQSTPKRDTAAEPLRPQS